MKKRTPQPEPEEVNVPKMIVGLDIGTTKIVMVMGYLCDDGRVEVCGYGKAPSTGVQFGLVLNLQDTIDGITMQESGVSRQLSVRFEDVTEDGDIIIHNQAG